MGLRDGAVGQRLRDEEIRHGIVMAARPAHAGRRPGVDHLGVGRVERALKVDGAAAGAQPLLIAVPDMAAHVKPARDPDIASLGPAAGHAIAAGHGDGAAPGGAEPPMMVRRGEVNSDTSTGSASARTVPVIVLVEMSTLQPTALSARVSSSTTIEVRERLHLPAPERARQEHPVEPGVRERLHDRLRQRPPALDLVGRGANAGRQLARRRQQIVTRIARRLGTIGRASARWARGTRSATCASSSAAIVAEARREVDRRAALGAHDHERATRAANGDAAEAGGKPRRTLRDLERIGHERDEVVGLTEGRTAVREHVAKTVVEWAHCRCCRGHRLLSVLLHVVRPRGPSGCFAPIACPMPSCAAISAWRHAAPRDGRALHQCLQARRRARDAHLGRRVGRRTFLVKHAIVTPTAAPPSRASSGACGRCPTRRAEGPPGDSDPRGGDRRAGGLRDSGH